MMLKTVTAETAATPRAKFLFFSIFFSLLSLVIKSVTLTLPETVVFIELFSNSNCVLIPKSYT